MKIDYEYFDSDELHDVEKLVYRLEQEGNKTRGLKVLKGMIEDVYEDLPREGICPMCGGEIVSIQTSSATLEEPAYGYDKCECCGEEYGDW